MSAAVTHPAPKPPLDRLFGSNFLGGIFRKDPARAEAEALYAAIAAQARAPSFYLAGGAPDTAEGRFEVLALHMYLAIDRLKAEGESTRLLLRRVQEVFFERLDSALREMGVGDLVVGRKIRALAESFYGRVLAYDQGFLEGGDSLAAAIARNIHSSPDAAHGKAIANYLVTAREKLKSAPAPELAAAFASLGAVSSAIDQGSAPRATS